MAEEKSREQQVKDEIFNLSKSSADVLIEWVKEFGLLPPHIYLVLAADIPDKDQSNNAEPMATLVCRCYSVGICQNPECLVENLCATGTAASEGLGDIAAQPPAHKHH